jgi:hypothetical protein
MVIANLLNQTIYYAAKTGQDKYNKPTFGTSVELYAREQQEIELLNDPGRQELAQITILYVENDGSTVLQSEGQITLSDGTIRPILAVKIEKDRLGNTHHYKIWLGLSRIQSRR